MLDLDGFVEKLLAPFRVGLCLSKRDGTLRSSSSALVAHSDSLLDSARNVACQNFDGLGETRGLHEI